MDDVASAFREDEKFIKDIREEVEAFDSDEEDDVSHKSLNRRNRFFKFISEQRKSLHAKAYFAFPNPRDEGAYVLENSNFRRPYDIAIYGYLYLIWGSELYHKYFKWGRSFDWYALSMFTNCDVTEDTMRITGYERVGSALFFFEKWSPHQYSWERHSSPSFFLASIVTVASPSSLLLNY